MEGDSFGKRKGDEEDEDSVLYDSEYIFNSQEEEVNVDNLAMSRLNTDPQGAIKGVGYQGEDEVHLDYSASKELQTNIGEEEMDPSISKYAEFNKDFDMKDPLVRD